MHGEGYGLVRYIHDILYVCLAVLVLAVVTDYAWLLLWIVRLSLFGCGSAGPPPFLTNAWAWHWALHADSGLCRLQAVDQRHLPVARHAQQRRRCPRAGGLHEPRRAPQSRAEQRRRIRDRIPRAHRPRSPMTAPVPSRPHVYHCA